MCFLYMYNVICGSINPSLPILMTFTFFSWLISVARIFDTKSNRSGKSGHPCLVSEFREKTFSFSKLSMMLAVHLSRMAFIMLIYVPYILFDKKVRVFKMNGCWILSKAFPASTQMVIWFLPFLLLMWYIPLIKNFKPFLHAWNNFNFYWCMGCLYLLLNLVW